jgi:divalent metal cation (Fe/Co/Zn/Cd) transporter
MSLGGEVATIAVDLAMAAVHEILDRELHPDQKARALDALAERAKYDAEGQRKLDARRRQKGG